jgi:flagellar motor switch protein FliM
MEKVLNQEEIDAMFRAALGRGGSNAEVTNVSSWNYQQAGQITKEQVRAIGQLHEGFARNLARSLGAYLRVGFETNLVSVEQLAYREFLGRTPDMAYCASFTLQPLNAIAVMEIDQSLAFPIIELLLGGQGNSEVLDREITEIEEEILSGVGKIFCHELESTWSPLELSFQFGEREQPNAMQRLMPPNEKTLALSFEIHMAEARGMLNVVFPAVVSNALLRKLSSEWGYQRRRGPQETVERLKKILLDCPMEIELGLPDIPIPIDRLMHLKPGEVLPFPEGIEHPAMLRIAGCGLFSGIPVRSGSHVAARVIAPLPYLPQ